MKIFVEADSIAYGRMSGIGHTTLEILREFDDRMATDKALQVTAIIPRHTSQIVRKYNLKNVKLREIPISQKYINYLLTRTSLPIPIDLWFGKGVYIFPNYKTWYTPFSQSITFMHDVAFKLFPKTVNPKNLVYLEANFTRWLKRATIVATITQASAQEIQTFFPGISDKLQVVPLGVNTTQYYPQPAAKVNAVRNKYRIPAEYFLFVGNIEPRKNIYSLLCAYEGYANGRTKASSLVLVGGDGWQNQNILEKIKAMQASGLSVIRPEEYVDDEDLPALYSGSLSIIQWSLHEGFGLPPLQAQACGAPVIASNIASLKEILDASNTTFLEPSDIKGMSEALSKAVKVSAKNSVNKMSFKYTWTKTVSHLLSISAMVR